ncbi:6-phosphogluconolactonase [soil metagenome]
MSVHVYESPEELAEAAASEFATRAAGAIEERGRFTAVLAGGSTPRATFEILARDYAGRIDWGKVHVFFGDERSVPPDDEDSNYRMASEALLDHVPVASIHRMQGELPPEEAAEAYEEELRDFFGPDELPEFDLILLGIGGDGHTASLFPETSALEVHDRWVVANPVLKLETTRITLTVPVINAAHAVYFLVAGEGKADALGQILSGDADPREYPASLIQPQGGPKWMLDQPAASELP